MKVYHYTHDFLWDEIVRGSDKGKGQPGLAATKRMGKFDQQAWETTAVFALLAPLPDSWLNNPHFKNIWQHLLMDIGRVMLEIEIDPQTDNAYVVDRAHIQGFLDKDRGAVPLQFQHDTRREAERNYMLSRVHLGDYLQGDSFNYSLPEVVIPQHVPLDKISVSLQQPLLELRLALRETRNVTADSVLNGQMKSVLTPWRQAYEATHGPLQDLLEPNEDIIEILNKMNGEFCSTSAIGRERTIKF